MNTWEFRNYSYLKHPLTYIYIYIYMSFQKTSAQIVERTLPLRDNGQMKRIQ